MHANYSAVILVFPASLLACHSSHQPSALDRQVSSLEEEVASLKKEVRTERVQIVDLEGAGGSGRESTAGACNAEATVLARRSYELRTNLELRSPAFAAMEGLLYLHDPGVGILACFEPGGEEKWRVQVHTYDFPHRRTRLVTRADGSLLLQRHSKRDDWLLIDGPREEPQVFDPGGELVPRALRADSSLVVDRGVIQATPKGKDVAIEIQRGARNAELGRVLDLATGPEGAIFVLHTYGVAAKPGNVFLVRYESDGVPHSEVLVSRSRILGSPQLHMLPHWCVVAEALPGKLLLFDRDRMCEKRFLEDERIMEGSRYTVDASRSMILGFHPSSKLVTEWQVK